MNVFRLKTSECTHFLSVLQLCLLKNFTDVRKSTHASRSCWSRIKRRIKISFKLKKGPQPPASHLSIGQITLGCTKQPADSQRRWDRERRCSRRTRGPPSASLLSGKSPSSPRRRSSEGEKKKQTWRGGGWEEEGEALKSSVTRLVRYRMKGVCTFIRKSRSKSVSERFRALQNIFYHISTLRLLQNKNDGFTFTLKWNVLKVKRFLQAFPWKWEEKRTERNWSNQTALGWKNSFDHINKL